MPLTSCAVCGKAMVVAPARLRSGRGRYCSRACHQIVLQAARGIGERVCAWCGASIVGKRVNALYCSRVCAAEAMHVLSGGEKRCAWCNTVFFARTRMEKFCSSVCEARFAAHKGKVPIMQDPWSQGLIALEGNEAEGWHAPDPSLGF